VELEEYFQGLASTIQMKNLQPYLQLSFLCFLKQHSYPISSFLIKEWRRKKNISQHHHAMQQKSEHFFLFFGSPRSWIKNQQDEADPAWQPQE
jgi:hypothetical protein